MYEPNYEMKIRVTVNNGCQFKKCVEKLIYVKNWVKMLGNKDIKLLMLFSLNYLKRMPKKKIGTF